MRKASSPPTDPALMEQEVEGASTNLMQLDEAGPIQMGFWVPNRLWATAKFLVPLRRDIEAKRAMDTLKPLTPVMAAFKNWVDTHGIYRMWVTMMIDQANAFIKEQSLSTDKEILLDGDVLWIPSYDFLFEALNEIVTTSPAFNNTAMVGTPMNGLLAVSMGTPAGAALFHDATFNQQFKKVLDSWNDFLKGCNSLDLLDIEDPDKFGSWISEKAWEAGVWDQMVCHPHLPAYGYTSWNAFFIREFVPGARPFYGDPATQINIGCETTPWEYQHDIAFESDYWVKTVNYSLLDIFGGRRLWAEQFTGGQLYQGFLSATHYHRWRAPLDGKIVRSWIEPGTYFAQRPAQGEDKGTWEGTQSQPYLGQVATRAVFIFEHPLAGFVALVCIGMVEVSTCVIYPDYLVEDGADPVLIKRDTEIGRFEFGGSTHMMIFQKDRVVLEDWARHARLHRRDKNPTAMGTVIATACRR